jgi:hypothetical protein
MTPVEEEIDQLRRQNALLMRALLRLKAERLALTKKIEALTAAHATEAVTHG